MSKYQICTRCIMDTSDPEIVFDDQGVCNHCHSYDEKVKLYSFKNNPQKLEEIVSKIKEDGKNKKYDCILGLSGGVDSSYLVYLTHELGIRPFIVHVDAGWNTEVAEKNINKICSKYNLDIKRIVVDWPTMMELQRAYMFSGLANLDIPQDHAFLAGVYEAADEYNLKYMINGSNLATEGILPASWGYSAVDYKHIKGVYAEHGRGKSLADYPHFSLWKYLKMQQATQRVNLLNYVEYSLKGAIETLENEFGWEYYGGKHYESVFTRYFQGVYLPEKFGYDKKRAHLSSLVVSGEISRDEAMQKMDSKSSYSEEQQREDLAYILDRLEISQEEWNNQIMAGQNKTADDYPSSQRMLDFLISAKRMIHKRK